MRKKWYLAISLTLSLCLLLNIYVFSGSAGDIMVSGGVGTHTFNLSEPGDYIISDGSFTITNTMDEDVDIQLIIDDALKPVDLGEEGRPRTHTPTGGRLAYHIPDTSWIQLKNETEILPAQSIIKIEYTIRVNIEDLYEALDGNINKSYLCYINARGVSTKAIGINYDHKVFLVFTGEFRKISLTTNLLPLFLGLFFMTITIICIIFSLVMKNKKDKKKVPIFSVTEDRTPTKNEIPSFSSGGLLKNLELEHTLSELEGKNEQK